jgi:hypothetical protein
VRRRGAPHIPRHIIAVTIAAHLVNAQQVKRIETGLPPLRVVDIFVSTMKPFWSCHRTCT